MTRPEPEIIEVDRARLQWGTWNHDKDRDEGCGDIRASYSADIIATSRKVRKPFTWRGSLMVCVGSMGRGGVDEAQAYRLVPVRMFEGTPTTYSDKTGTADGAEAARNDPRGFYDAITVKHGKDEYVMSGPPVRFVATEEPVRPEKRTEPSSQLCLFD